MNGVENTGLPVGPVIDRLIHEPVRLEIMVLLCNVREADFLSACDRIDVTRGNLSSHMTRLADAGYIEVKKEFVGRTPRTRLRITTRGIEALRLYRTAMQSLLSGK